MKPLPVSLRLVSVVCLWFLTILLAACGSGGGSTQQPPPGSPPSLALTADKTTVSPGELVTLHWTTTNATGLTVQPPLGEDDLDLPGGSANVAPSATTTYLFTATGPTGSRQSSITISVNAVVPTITISANPTSILVGQSTILSWNSENATAVAIDNGVGDVPPNGTKTVVPAATTTYTATATGPGGTKTATVTITVAAGGQLAASISANPTTITIGQSSTLTWSTQNAASVTLNGNSVALSGTQTVSPAATTAYNLVASDSGGGTKSASATVTVLASNGGLQNIKHIIFYMNENRSFDNYFGRLGHYRQGKGLPAEIDGLDLNKVLKDYYEHEVKPFHMPTTCMEVTSPGWNESHFFAHRRSNGTFGMDFWMMQQNDSQGSTIDPHYTRSMGYYTEADLPYYYELATQFATSDRWYSDIMGPTIPNRMYLFTGTSFGFIRPDSRGPDHPKYTQKTIFQLLNEHGITWRYYYQGGDVYLYQFDIWNDPASQGRVRNIAEYYNILASPDADRLLPQVVFIEQPATLQLNEHPSNKWGVQPGAANTKKIVDALMSSAAWSTSAFILTYDEAGGIYDHVPPIQVPAPDNTPPDLRSTDIGEWDQFTYSGFRVPVIVVSPWVKKNFVSHTPRTFASILKLIQTRFGLPSLTNRDGSADDMTEFFDFSSPAWMTPPPMPAQPWFCDPNAAGEATNKTCQKIIDWLGPVTGSNTCDLSHRKEVAPGHPVEP